MQHAASQQVAGRLLNPERLQVRCLAYAWLATAMVGSLCVCRLQMSS